MVDHKGWLIRVFIVVLVGDDLGFPVYALSTLRGADESCLALWFVRTVCLNKFPFPFVYCVHGLWFKFKERPLQSKTTEGKKNPLKTTNIINALIAVLFFHFAWHMLLRGNVWMESGHPVGNLSPRCLLASVHYSYTHAQNAHLHCLWQL